MPARPSTADPDWRERLHQTGQGHVIGLDTPLGQELFEVAVGPFEAQLPPDGEKDDLRWATEPGKCRTGLVNRPDQSAALLLGNIVRP
jgi:hypothetical protein